MKKSIFNIVEKFSPIRLGEELNFVEIAIPALVVANLIIFILTVFLVNMQ